MCVQCPPLSETNECYNYTNNIYVVGSLNGLAGIEIVEYGKSNQEKMVLVDKLQQNVVITCRNSQASLWKVCLDPIESQNETSDCWNSITENGLVKTSMTQKYAINNDTTSMLTIRGK